MEIFLCKTKVIFGISSSSFIDSYITVNVSRKKKSVPVPNKVLKTSLFVFCKPPKEFSSNCSQTFNKYSSSSSSSLTIAPFRTDEHSRCYGSPQNWGFCPQISIFGNKASIWCKIKVIFGISSSSCVELCIIKALSWKRFFNYYPKNVPTNWLSRFCKRYKQLQSNSAQTLSESSSM